MYVDPPPIPADIVWMDKAIKLATNGYPNDMPFGCVLVREGVVYSATWGTGNHGDPTSHSEIRAIQEACRQRDHPFEETVLLKGFTLYSTHEPCAMCCGAINHAKISRVVWGSYRTDLPQIFRPKIPAETLLADTSHPPVAVGGVLRTECIDLFTSVLKWD